MDDRGGGVGAINRLFAFDFLLPPADEVWGKVIFSVACVKNSVHRGGLPQCMLGYHPLGADTPLGADIP